MNTRSVARVAWVIPVLLLLLTIHQVITAVDLRKTLDEGEQTYAEVLRYERSDRKDVTHVELDLRIHLADGSTFDHTHLALPYSIGHRVEADTLQVTVLPGADQDVVITQIGRTQISIAWSNAAMAFVAFLMAFAGVFSWNRWLTRSGSAA